MTSSLEFWSVLLISRGLISVKGRNSCSIDGIVAHVSSLACPKVHVMASSLRGRLSAEMLSRLEIWPKTFMKNGGPKDECIALFFFASSERYTWNTDIFFVSPYAYVVKLSDHFCFWFPVMMKRFSILLFLKWGRRIWRWDACLMMQNFYSSPLICYQWVLGVSRR